MPRFVERAEAILDQVATVRESINELNARLRQVSVFLVALHAKTN